MRQTPGGGYTLVNGTVQMLITSAFPPMPSEPIGLPGWVTSERYDVTATAALPGTPTVEDRQAMMRALLADRFRFAAHVEKREEAVYDLVLARADGRLGSAMKPSEADCEARAAAARAEAEAARAAGGPPPPPPTFTPPAPGSPVPPCSLRMGGNQMEGDVTMAALARYIRPMAGRFVVDKTGLVGSYRIKLEVARMLRAPNPDAAPGPLDDAPSVFTALPDQLGLTLEGSRAQLDVLVIDHIERPSEN